MEAEGPVVEDAEICDNWEQIEENSELLEKQLEKLRIQKGTKVVAAAGPEGDPSVRLNGNSASGGSNSSVPQFRILTRSQGEREADKGQGRVSQIELDSTTQESLRTQYVPPEPKLKILSRPKTSDPNSLANGGVKSKKTQVTKSLQQREQEYAEARMRILGDVRFLEEEHEAALESSLSPAEILKLKISEAMQNEPTTPSSTGAGTAENASGTSGVVVSEDGTTEEAGSGVSKAKSKKKAKANRVPNPSPPIDFPLSKADADRIVRQPRGPDGSNGFALKR